MSFKRLLNDKKHTNPIVSDPKTSLPFIHSLFLTIAIYFIQFVYIEYITFTFTYKNIRTMEVMIQFNDPQSSWKYVENMYYMNIYVVKSILSSYKIK